MKDYRRLLAYLRPYVWPRGVLAVLCMLAYSAVEGTIPFVIRFTLGVILPGQAATPAPQGVPVPPRPDLFHGPYDQSVVLPWVALAILVFALLRGGFDFAGKYLTDWIGQRVVTDLRNELTAHMQRLDLAFFNRRRAGQIVSRITADVTLVRGMVTDALSSIFQDAATLLVLIAVAFRMDWVLATLALCLFPVAAIPLRYVSAQLRQNSRRMQEGMGHLNALLHENVQGNRVVKAFNQEGYEQRRFKRQNEHLLRLYMRSSVLRGMPVTEVLAGIAIAGIIWYAGRRLAAHPAYGKDLVAFFATLLLLYEPFKKLVRTNYSIQQGLGGAERVFQLLDTPSQVVDRPGAGVLRGVRDAIEFHDVGFAYEVNAPVLRHINLHIPVGQLVALVGVSGGGKSTLADLIPRFYDATSGRITIDGVDIRDLTLASLRRQIAVVTQFTFLFNDTIRNNIAYGDPDRPHAETEAAARAANAHEFIAELPKGYETSIGDLGVRLSGGQRQRIAIARALLKNAPILILDEATSALDTESEGLVQEALERLMANRTTLVVAHRLSTVRRADRIVVVVRGEIVESGTHEELLARGTEYRKLYELQFRDVDTLDGVGPGGDGVRGLERRRPAEPAPRIEHPPPRKVAP